MYRCVRTDTWIEARWVGYVEGNHGVIDEKIPSIFGEILIDSGEDCNEMIFEGLDGKLCWITSMIARWYELVIQILVFFDDTDEFVGYFVIKFELFGC